MVIDQDKLGVDNDMADAIRNKIIPPGPLWKYLSLSPSQDPTWQEKLTQICIDRKIYCSSPRDFNDPFDCLPCVVSPQSQPDIEAGTNHLIARFIDSLPQHSPDEIEREARAGILSFSPEELEKWSKIACEGTASKMGAFCLSERIDNVLMWSHYANNHTGVAIKFEPLVNLKGGLMPLFKVRYQDARPKISYFASDEAIDFADALTTKATFWEYEREWRKIVPDGAGKFVQIDQNIVTGLVFGINCSDNLRQAVKSVLSSRTMDFWQVIPSSEHFAIQFQKSE